MLLQRNAVLFLGVIALSSACQGGYPIAPTPCDRWCDATKGGSCGLYYDPAGCVVTCEAQGFGSKAMCKQQFDVALACFQSAGELCSGVQMVPVCLDEETALYTCAQSQTTFCGDATPCVDRGVPGMIAWYSFEYGNGVVEDSAGCDDRGSVVGDLAGVARCQPGRVGNAFQFGLGTVVSIPSSPSFADLRKLTVEAWLWPEPDGVVVSYGDGQGGDSFRVDVYGGQLRVSLGAAFGQAYPADCQSMSTFVDPALSILPYRRWVHVAVVVDDQARIARYYIDGNLDGSQPIDNGAICATREPLIVGGGNALGSAPFYGRLDELKLWNVLRSDTEICTDAGGVFAAGKCAL